MKRLELANRPSPDCANSAGTKPAAPPSTNASVETPATNSADARMPRRTARLGFEIMCSSAPDVCDGIALGRHDPLVQAGDRVERRENRPFLPRRNVGCMLSGKENATVDRAKILVVFLPRRVAPRAGAAKRP